MQASKIYRQVPNFNLIPPEYQKPIISGRRRWLRFGLVILIVAELIFIQNLYREKSALEAASAAIKPKMLQSEEKLNLVNATKALGVERQALEDDWRALATQQTNWPQVLAALFQSKPKGVTLSSLSREGGRLNTTGSASDYTALIEYRHLLLASPVISHIVSLQSVLSESAVFFTMVVEPKIGGE